MRLAALQAPTAVVAPSAPPMPSWERMSDDLGPAALVGSALRGAPGAMERLLAHLGPHVLRATRCILASRADAEEAAQESMLVLVRDLPTLRNPEAVIPFAVRVASRIAMRMRARQRREHAAIVRLEAEAVPMESTSPAAELAGRERADRLLDLLQGLPEEQAQTLVLRYVAGFRPAEIAAAMQVPVNTVRSRARLGREALARTLVGDPVLGKEEVVS